MIKLIGLKNADGIGIKTMFDVIIFDEKNISFCNDAIQTGAICLKRARRLDARI